MTAVNAEEAEMTLSDSNQSNETDIDALRNYIENHHSLSQQKTSSADRILLGSTKIQYLSETTLNDSNQFRRH